MNGLQEVPATTSMATGVSAFNLSLDKKKINFWAVAEGLSGAISSAHLHTAPAGMNGGVAIDLSPFINGTFISGVVDVPDVAFVTAIEAGEVYLNIHTAAEPNGEIRGQLSLDAGVAFDAALDTMQEVEPVTGGNGKGVAYFSIAPDFSEITYSVQVSGLSGAIMGAHLHSGVAGVDGLVLVDLSGDVNGNEITGTIDGTDLTDELIHELLESGVYINIHTSMNMNGELRGQINRVAREGYTIRMDGSQEVPAVTTGANGGGIVTIARERNNAHVMVVAQNMLLQFLERIFIMRLQVQTDQFCLT